MYNIVALIGEAGSGKDTIMKQIITTCPNEFNEIISCTSRPKREGEKEGINYFYYSPEEFERKVLNNEMLEHTEFNNWYYGTSNDALRSDRLNIGVFNPDGIRILSANPNVKLTVYKIMCSPKTRLLRQLNRENNPNVDEIIRRYVTDKNDFDHLWEEIKYIEVENEDEEDLGLATYAILSDLGIVD